MNRGVSELRIRAEYVVWSLIFWCHPQAEADEELKQSAEGVSAQETVSEVAVLVEGA